jgi:hypothetical protein
MKHVSVVGTVHEESGLASASALLAILVRIKPEVIFLEIPAAAFDDFLNGTRRNLESSAARRYRGIQDVVLIPVDLPTPEMDFFRDNEYLYERIAERHSDVRRLIGSHSRAVFEYGFAYLNSERCVTLWSDFYDVMETGINEIGDPRLTERYKEWHRINELRDKAMLKNIENYCSQNSFGTGAFLVGAAHRERIINISRGLAGADSPTIKWDFAGFLEAPN